MEYKGVNVDTFLHECEDLLRQVEETVLEQRTGAASEAAIHGLFRAFHSIKGAAGLVGFESVAAFTHSVENVLDRVRRGELELSGSLCEIILASKDRIAALIAATLHAEPLPPQAALLSQLQAYEGRRRESLLAPPKRAVFHRYAIRLAPQRAFATSDFNLPAVLTELQQLGRLQVTLDASGVPALEQLEEERCYLVFHCNLMADCDEQSVRDTFLFAPADAELSITQQPELGFAMFSTAPPKAALVPQPLAAAEKVQRAQVPDAVVRVSSQKLDRLVALVGELVINQSRLSGVAERIRDAELAEPVEQIERLVVELRESVLGVRMMPIGSTFGRFKRLVHDLSAQLGKQVSLVTEGAETELDKTVLDRLVEPLVHLLRNSLDHGIEPAEARTRAGKPAQGCIRLTAAHVGQQVVVKLSDDGRGLDAAAIRHKAIERGLISADQTLPAADLYKLIFLPGFSTAKQVTDVSGRGVGMDVVKSQIDALRGSVSISSDPGKGTTIALALPLTLAIIDGLLVELAGERYIIAHGMVHETVELSADEGARHNGRTAISVRGQLVPYIRLRDEFALTGELSENEKVVIVQYEDERVGLVVDRVLGGHQTVIQSLGRVYREIEVVSGATITGDGRVAFILNIDGIVRRTRLTAARAVEGVCA